MQQSHVGRKNISAKKRDAHNNFWRDCIVATCGMRLLGYGQLDVMFRLYSEAARIASSNCRELQVGCPQADAKGGTSQ
eukprot:2559233-Amphidinium_carterae.1